MMTCLVTGATGLLGRHLVDTLVEARVAVRAFVRRGSDVRRLAQQGVQLAWGDGGDLAAIGRAVAGVDVVFHAAGYLTANAPFAVDDSEEDALYQAVNVDFTEAVLAASVQAGVERFLYVSSSSVYAPDAAVPTPEEGSLGPTTAYGRSKLAAEEAVRSYQQGGLAATIARPPLIYGPDDRYFTPLALRLARLPVLPLVNGGRALMDLIYARDVAELLWRAATRPEAVGRVYNAGPGDPTSLRALVESYRALTGRGPRILPVSPALAGRTAWLSQLLMGPVMPEARAALSPQGVAMMARDLHLSMDRAAAELDFRPRYDLENGLRETLGL